MQEKKLRATRQRQIILEELKKVTSHPTADEIYEMVRKRLPRISLGTVYRNLEVLSECGLILKLGPGHAQMRFDGTVENHYHVRCIKCGRVDDLYVKPIEEINKQVRGTSDYEIIDHRLEFDGICPGCKSNP